MNVPINNKKCTRNIKKIFSFSFQVSESHSLMQTVRIRSNAPHADAKCKKINLCPRFGKVGLHNYHEHTSHLVELRKEFRYGKFGDGCLEWRLIASEGSNIPFIGNVL